MTEETTVEQQLGPYPSVDEVLNKLKYNGTFDQFRKSCLGSIEAEPSFRAYGEHIEVVSRRYLQNYKWRDSTTKNQIRSRLKNHALSVIASPDIQVGVSFSSLVEKAMESKGKELLPSIQSVITSLRQTKPPPNPSNKDSIGAAKPVKTDNGSGTTTSSSKMGVEFDLSLPIDLPGLVSTPAPTIAPKKPLQQSEVKTSGRVKPKPGEASSKEGRGSVGAKAKLQTSEASKEAKAKEEKKEDTEKSSAVSDDVVAKDKKLTRLKKAKEEKSKDEMKEKMATGKPTKAGNEESVGEVAKEGKVKSKTDPPSKVDPLSSKTNTPSNTKESEERVEAPSSKRVSEGKEKQVQSDERVEAPSSKRASEGKEKQLPPRRRSARIASLTEDPRKNEDSDVEASTKTDLPRRSPRRRLSEGGDVEEQTKTGRKKASSGGKTTAPTRKRTRKCVSSSSGESDTESESRHKRGKVDKTRSKKQARRRTPEQRESTTPLRRSRRNSKTGSGSPASSITQEKMDIEQELPATSSSSNRRKSKRPQRVVSRSSRSPVKSRSPIKSPTPVVTRFNRHVKPNRKYYDSEQEEEEGGSGLGESEEDSNSGNGRDHAYKQDSYSSEEDMSEQNE